MSEPRIIQMNTDFHKYNTVGDGFNSSRIKLGGFKNPCLPDRQAPLRNILMEAHHEN